MSFSRTFVALGLITYINPDCLACLDLLVLNLVLQLRRNQAEHILTAMEKTTAGGIIDSRLMGKMVSSLQW